MRTKKNICLVRQLHSKDGGASWYATKQHYFSIHQRIAVVEAEVIWRGGRLRVISSGLYTGVAAFHTKDV